MEHATPRTIVDLVPRYAHARRAGWTPSPELHDSITLPEYVVLRRVAIEREDGPIPDTDLRANALNPYCTFDSFLDPLPRLVELGLLDQSGDQYVLSPAGRDLMMRGERAANDYAAKRMHLPPDDLARLAVTLSDIAELQRRAPEPAVKAHQDIVPRLRRFDPRQTPPVQLEFALYALQRARDDAHLAAWRADGFRGPSLELLSHVWAGDVATIADLVELTCSRMRSEDVTTLLDDLARDGYLTLQSTGVTITDRGREARDAIERETDRVNFAPWPEIDVEWVCDRLEALAVGLTR